MTPSTEQQLKQLPEKPDAVKLGDAALDILKRLARERGVDPDRLERAIRDPASTHHGDDPVDDRGAA